MEPNFPIGMSICKSLKKRRWAIVVEVDSADNVCDWVKGARGREWVAEKGRHFMAWNQLIVEHEIGPVGVEVKEVDPPSFVLAV